MLMEKLKRRDGEEMLTQKETDLKSAVGAMKKNLTMEVQVLKGLMKAIEMLLIMESSSVKGCSGQEAALKWEIVRPVLGPILRKMKGEYL
ncbi:hypothetical protein SLEP1_g38105 [Rubroshorea leprosula]|uniref:Uncharacterized protein n=1 Tax=Rubroshorea leprosula TaxID=152421 RepID=A0AAV5KX02_9ROSI|nr:hypothetical protein SLEP1_g38105 [Rubroshorea leprosula]